ncbi:MAG: VOC family protein [Gemmatimonas sp.]
MAVTVQSMRIGITSRDGGRLVAFYRDALGFTPSSSQRADDLARTLGGDTARAEIVCARLGDQEIEIATFAPHGAPYPPDIVANDLRFQHFAVVVSDMKAAFTRLQAVGGWTAISRGGPQELPETFGGVTAFKFRDPDGHPLELLEFTRGEPDRWRGRSAPGPCLGIDHTAITVSDTARSVAFYRELLAVSVAETSLNRGAEQQDLDGIPAPVVSVTSLRRPTSSDPGIELLRYSRTVGSDPPRPTAVAATRLMVAVDSVANVASRIAALGGTPLSAMGGYGQRRALAAHDPDGHLLVFLAPA